MQFQIQTCWWTRSLSNPSWIDLLATLYRARIAMAAGARIGRGIVHRLPAGAPRPPACRRPAAAAAAIPKVSKPIYARVPLHRNQIPIPSDSTQTISLADRIESPRWKTTSASALGSWHGCGARPGPTSPRCCASEPRHSEGQSHHIVSVLALLGSTAAAILTAAFLARSLFASQPIREGDCMMEVPRSAVCT
jgi:hypothetical protein